MMPNTASGEIANKAKSDQPRTEIRRGQEFPRNEIFLAETCQNTRFGQYRQFQPTGLLTKDTDILAKDG
jgi:hypothetical protein